MGDTCTVCFQRQCRVEGGVTRFMANRKYIFFRIMSQNVKFQFNLNVYYKLPINSKCINNKIYLNDDIFLKLRYKRIKLEMPLSDRINIQAYIHTTTTSKCGYSNKYTYIPTIVHTVKKVNFRKYICGYLTIKFLTEIFICTRIFFQQSFM